MKNSRMNIRNLNTRTVLIVAVIVLSLIAFGAFRLYQKSAEKNEAPVIKFDKSSVTMSVSATDAQLLRGVTATDKEDGDVSSSLVVEGYSHLMSDNSAVVTYVAFDSNNHIAKATRVVRFTDYIDPEFYLTAPLVCTISEIDKIPLLVGATDCFDGDISTRVRVTPTDDKAITEEGEHTIELRVTNSLGVTEHLTLPVEVVRSTNNRMELTLTDYLIYLPVGSEFNAEDYFKSYLSDGERHVGMTGEIYADTGELDMETAGIYTVDYECGDSLTRLIVVVY